MRLKAWGRGNSTGIGAFRAMAVDMRTHPVITWRGWTQSALSNVARTTRVKGPVRASPWKILIWIAELDEATATDWLIRQSSHAGKADATGEKFFHVDPSTRPSLSPGKKQLQKRLALCDGEIFTKNHKETVA